MPFYHYLLLHLAGLLPEGHASAKQLTPIDEALEWLYADTCRAHELDIAEAHALARDTDHWEAKLLAAFCFPGQHSRAYDTGTQDVDVATRIRLAWEAVMRQYQLID